MHYIYIIQSLKDGTYYKGYSLAPLKRLTQHNSGDTHYTSKKTPWELVHIEVFEEKKDALIREKKLKKYSHAQIMILRLSVKNILETLR